MNNAFVRPLLARRAAGCRGMLRAARKAVFRRRSPQQESPRPAGRTRGRRGAAARAGSAQRRRRRERGAPRCRGANSCVAATSPAPQRCWTNSRRHRLDSAQWVRHSLLRARLELEAGDAAAALARLDNPALQAEGAAVARALQIELALARADTLAALQRHLDERAGTRPRAAPAQRRDGAPRQHARNLRGAGRRRHGDAGARNRRRSERRLARVAGARDARARPAPRPRRAAGRAGALGTALCPDRAAAAGSARTAARHPRTHRPTDPRRVAAAAGRPHGARRDSRAERLPGRTHAAARRGRTTAARRGGRYGRLTRRLRGRLRGRGGRRRRHGHWPAAEGRPRGVRPGAAAHGDHARAQLRRCRARRRQPALRIRSRRRRRGGPTRGGGAQRAVSRTPSWWPTIPMPRAARRRNSNGCGTATTRGCWARCISATSTNSAAASSRPCCSNRAASAARRCHACSGWSSCRNRVGARIWT